MDYEEIAMLEMEMWRRRMQRKPSLVATMTRRVQARINRAIPEKIHIAVTEAIKQMTRAVLLGAEFTNPRAIEAGTLEEREARIRERIRFYRNTAAAEGAITGAGGILLGLADFPLWLTLKMKLLFEISACYGHNVANYKERLFLLYVFQLTFSSQQGRNEMFPKVERWNEHQRRLPADIHGFDWLTFQLEYRDYIDLAKLVQLIPGIGAPVGAIVNHRLTDKLGTMAMNAFRLRWSDQKKIAGPFLNPATD